MAKKSLKRVKSSSIDQIKKRDGTIVPFDKERISIAIHKAMMASEEGSENEAKTIATKVVHELEQIIASKKRTLLDVETIQDNVEKALILNGYAKTAKAYILYRQKHADMRKQAAKISPKVKQLFHDSQKFFRNTLSYVVYLRSYARWIEGENRRETWIETVDRYMAFMREKTGNKFTSKEYQMIHNAILKLDVLPSMRLMQFAGPATKATNVNAYNCSYIAPASLEDFGEVMYVSMCGCGVGFSVESQNIQSLPIIKKQSGKMLATLTIKDSKEGWCEAFVKGLKTWYEGQDIQFNYSKLRPLGARLKTSGGKSSGPEPLRNLLDFARSKIMQRQGRRLSNLDAHDILCKIGEVVISGGVRRSAMISLSDLDDLNMRNAKVGPFYYKEPQRSYANNSAVYEERPSNEALIEEWLALIKSGTGERGLFNRGSLNHTLPERRKKYFSKKGLITNGKITGFLGVNPCGEIILQSKQFCNLTEVVARPEDDEKSLLQKVQIAAMIGTYQATLTDFPYLSKDWKKHCDEEALLGVSITGQWDCETVRDPKTLEKLKKQAIKTNQIYAKRLGIRIANAVTCVKPSGTVSLVADCAPGMHPRFSAYYIRRVRIAATDALFKMLKDQGIPYHPEVGYSAESSPTFVVDFPIAAPKNAIFRNDLTAKDHLEYWKKVKEHYTEHNPSVTISVANNEWIGVLNWLDLNWDIIGGLSFLPRFEAVYRLPPFEEITKEQYQNMLSLFKNINFSKLPNYETSSS